MIALGFTLLVVSEELVVENKRIGLRSRCRFKKRALLLRTYSLGWHMIGLP
jgi:hypothetical protein